MTDSLSFLVIEIKADMFSFVILAIEQRLTDLTLKHLFCMVWSNSWSPLTGMEKRGKCLCTGTSLECHSFFFFFFFSSFFSSSSSELLLLLLLSESESLLESLLLESGKGRNQSKFIQHFHF